MSNKKKKKSVAGKIVLLFVLSLLLVLALIIAFFASKLDKIQYADETKQPDYHAEATDPNETSAATEPEEEEEIVDISGLEQVETAPPIPDSEVFEDSDVFNILLIGTDERTKEFSEKARSDSMILMSIDKKNNTVKLVSLERGIAAPVLEGQYKGQYDWLTHIFRYGGADLLMKTVEHCFKVDVDHYVRINFNAFAQVVDAIGGVDIELTKAESQALNGYVYTNAKTKHLVKEGVNHLDGYDALQYARLRFIDSDWVRVGRQRTVILAVVEALKDSSLLELNDLADTVLPMVQTNLTKLQIAELVLYAPNFLKASFDQMTIPKKGTYGGLTVMGGRGSFAIDFEVNNDLLHRFLYEGATSEELLAE